MGGARPAIGRTAKTVIPESGPATMCRGALLPNFDSAFFTLNVLESNRSKRFVMFEVVEHWLLFPVPPPILCRSTAVQRGPRAAFRLAFCSRRFSCSRR